MQNAKGETVMFKRSALAMAAVIAVMSISVPVMAQTNAAASIPARPILFSEAVNKNEISVKAMDRTMYVTADMLYVRSIPSTEGEVIGAFYCGESVKVTGQNSEDPGWFRIAFNDKEGFVSGEFLTDTAPAAAPAAYTAAAPAAYTAAAPAAAPAVYTAAVPAASPNGAPIIKTSYVYALSGSLVQINKDANGNWTDYNGTGITWVTDNEAVTEGGEVLTSYDPTPIADISGYLQTVMQ